MVVSLVSFIFTFFVLRSSIQTGKCVPSGGKRRGLFKKGAQGPSSSCCRSFFITQKPASPSLPYSLGSPRHRNRSCSRTEAIQRNECLPAWPEGSHKGVQGTFYSCCRGFFVPPESALPTSLPFCV